MKNQIDIKYLSLYLPYELAIANVSLSGQVISTYTMQYHDRNDEGIENVLYGVNQIPILWPIHCFKSSPSLASQDVEEIIDAIETDTVGYLRHDLFMHLVENYFDVFGWIDEGLAIDMNDVNFE